MNGAQCTLEVYNFLRESPMVRHLFVWVCRTKAGASRIKKASGRPQRMRTTADSVPSAYTLQQNFREEVSSVGPRRESKRHTSIPDPPPGSIKPSLRREAAPSLLNIRDLSNSSSSIMSSSCAYRLSEGPKSSSKVALKPRLSEPSGEAVRATLTHSLALLFRMFEEETIKKPFSSISVSPSFPV